MTLSNYDKPYSQAKLIFLLSKKIYNVFGFDFT